jgi:pyridoxine 5-phosphate synthase
VTVHLREDRRHIQDADVRAIRKADVLPLNLEMANAPAIVAIALKIRPDEVCLVPERRAELTTEGGLDAAGQREALAPTVDRLSRAGIRVSLFIAPDRDQIDAAVALGAPVIELHTGAFCEERGAAAKRELRRLIDGARYAQSRRLQVNAGHGITTDNLPDILRIPHLDTLNIGHSIVSRAVMIGMQKATAEMLAGMNAYAAVQRAEMRR